jgi:hypothetical protein
MRSSEKTIIWQEMDRCTLQDEDMLSNGPQEDAQDM